MVVSSGVIKTAIRVETAVRLTERAILVRAMKQTTLDAVPPGQQACLLRTAQDSGSPAAVLLL